MPIEFSTSTRGRGDEGITKDCSKSVSESAEEPDHPRGLDMIKLPWRRNAKPEPRLNVNSRLTEQETAKSSKKSSMMLDFRTLR